MISAIASNGRVLAFAPVLRPVVALKSGKTRGSSLDRVLREDGEEKPAEPGMARLSGYDIEQIDLTLLKTGLREIETLHGEEPSGVLFLPLAFPTLASSRGRREALTVIAEAQARLNAQIVLEISHIDPGLPPSRLLEILTLLRPTCPTVFARIKPDRQSILALADCTLAGVAIQAADIKEPEDINWLNRLRLILQAIGPRMIVHNLRSTAAMSAAHDAGVNYASLELTHMGGEIPELPRSETVAKDENGGQVAPAAA